MLNIFTFHAAHKVDNFSISLPGPVQLMRTGPFVDYNLMIAFSDSAAVNGTVSFLFSPPRAPRLRSIWQTQYLCFLIFLLFFIHFHREQLRDFVQNCEIQFLGCRDFPTKAAQRAANVTVGFQIEPPCPRVITNVAKYFRSSPLCLRVITKVAKYC